MTLHLAIYRLHFALRQPCFIHFDLKISLHVNQLTSICSLRAFIFHVLDSLELDGDCLAGLSSETQLRSCQSNDQGVVDIIQPNFSKPCWGSPAEQTDER